MKQKIFVLAGFLSILLLWTGCPNNAPVPAGSGSGSSGGGVPEATLKAYPADQAILCKVRAIAEASPAIGERYSIQLAKRPRINGYATVGDNGDGTGGGSFRIPAIVKTTVGGKTRLVAAFDVRYRGTFQGAGDCAQGSVYGSDITVMYSDNGGATWTEAKNKTTGKKPAIDVKNAYGPDGAPTDGATGGVELEADVCDPQLTVFPDGTIYCGMAGGAGILGRNWTNTNFRIFKSTDGGVTWEEDTDPADSYAKKWRASSGMNSNMSFNLTTPGHGIVLTKDVPGVSSMIAGTPVLPCQGGTIIHGGSNYYGIYLAHGSGAPATWNCGTTNSSSLGKYTGANTEEGQICQLDDGSLLMAAKKGGVALSRFSADAWTHVQSADNPFAGGAPCQVSILKIAEGNDTKCGVVAVCQALGSSVNAGSTAQGAGRGGIVVGFARDLTSKAETPADKPLDKTECYYVNIRKEKMSYFGYTDMVMVDDHTLGILYENWWLDNDKVDGMRFVKIDVSKIIEKLSVKP